MKLIKFNSVLSPLLLLSVAFTPGKTVIIGGENIGFGLKSDGIIVSGTYDLKTSGGIYNPKKDADIKEGDIINKVDGIKIDTIVDLNRHMASLSEGQLDLTLTRNSKTLNRKLRVFEIDGKYKTGLYVKERILGIGTLTYFDPENNTYGALGHQVKETYSDETFKIESGIIYESQVVGIKKSSDGKVGEKVATLNESKVLGDVIKNTEYGIYGHMDKPSGGKTYKLAKATQVSLGHAKAYTVIDGSDIVPFSINITSLGDPSKVTTKGISFDITDKSILSKTNGIVSGMSGSPIVQNDMLVGAITHVIVSDCDRGYGIYIEHMFDMLNM